MSLLVGMFVFYFYVRMKIFLIIIFFVAFINFNMSDNNVFDV